MNVLIFGAAGGIGKHAVNHALKAGHKVTAYVRNAKKITVSDPNLTVVEGQLSDPEAVRKAMEGQDAVIWCVGIPMKKNYPSMDSLEGHRILIPAMKKAGVKRLIDYGTPSIHFEKDKRSLITVLPGLLAGIALTKAKEECVAIGELVAGSGLDWTIIHFLAPKDTPYTGKVKVSFGDTKMKFAISREDIGAFMVQQLESTEYIHSMPIIGS